MKKMLISLMVFSFVSLMGDVPQTEPNVPLKEVVKSNQSVQEKGFHMEGIDLARHMWDLIQSHSWDHLKHRMDNNFTVFDIWGTVRNRTTFINFLRELNIQSYTLTPHKVVQYKDALEVKYLLSLRVEGVDVPIPEEHTSMFQKKDGKWLWRSESDLSIFLFFH